MMKLAYLKLSLLGVALLVCMPVVSRDYWLGKPLGRTVLTAGDYVYLTSLQSSTKTDFFLSAHMSKAGDGQARSARLSYYSGGTEVFELIGAPSQHEGVPSFYLRNIARDQYLCCSDTACVYVGSVSEATSLEIVKPTLQLGAFVNVTGAALLLAHYEDGVARYLIPDLAGGRISYSSSAGSVYWTFRAAMTQCGQVSAGEITNGMQVLFNNATNYLNVGPTQYLSCDTCTVKEPNNNKGFPLALSEGYDARNEWRILSSGDKYIVRNVYTNEYLYATEENGIRTTPLSSNALTVEFEPTEGNYTIHDWWVTNEKSLVMYHMEGETKLKVGPYRGYGYAYYSTGINNIAWNVYQTGYHPLEKDVLGYDETEDGDAIPGEQRAKNNVVSMDFGRPHVIKKIKYMASSAVKVQLGIFEGANNADYGDAIPFYMIKEEPSPGEYVTVDVNCSRGFRYVRYVGPKSAGSHRPKVSYYGDPGEGDDSQLYQVTNLPLVVMHTEKEAAVNSKTVYRPGIATIISDDGHAVLSDSMDVRGRGNGTWTLEKKPYKLKFKKKHRVLGLPAKAKKWVLLANHQDKSLMRNLVSFEMSKQIGMRYTPAGTPVDVVLNGEYMGNFDIYDQMEVKKNRIEVTEMTPNDNDYPNITGGYLIELDGYAGKEPVKFYSATYNAPLTVHYPEPDNITQQQLTYIKSHYDEMERRIFSDDPLNPETGISSYVDVESFIKRFILEEATANADAYWSMYIMKERNDDHFYFSPAWDLDHVYDIFAPSSPASSFNNYLCLVKGSNQGNIRGIISKIIETYNDTLVYLWSKYRLRGDLTYEHYEHYIDSVAALIDESQRLNFIRWPVLDKELPFGTGIRYTYENEVKFLKETLKTRLAWMDDHVGLDPSLVYERGDVNNDRHINLGDVVAGATFVQSQTVEGYIRQAADMNNDGKVERADLSLLVNRLLGETSPDVGVTAPGLTFGVSYEELCVGEEGVISVSYDGSSTPVCALQFDLTLPPGMTLESVTRAANLPGIFTVKMQAKENNTYSVVVYTVYSRTMPVGVPLLNLNVKLDATMSKGTYDMTLVHGLGSYTDSKVVRANDVSSPLHVLPPVGIRRISQDGSDDVLTYDLHGRRVRNADKGVYIEKGKKVVK